MYIESSTPQHPGDRARLVSPTYPPTIGSCLSFYYNMYGLTMGTLKVYLAGTGPAAPYQLLFQKSGNQVKDICHILFFDRRNQEYLNVLHENFKW